MMRDKRYVAGSVSSVQGCLVGFGGEALRAASELITLAGCGRGWRRRDPGAASPQAAKTMQVETIIS